MNYCYLLKYTMLNILVQDTLANKMGSRKQDQTESLLMTCNYIPPGSCLKQWKTDGSDLEKNTIYDVISLNNIY